MIRCMAPYESLASTGKVEGGEIHARRSENHGG